MNQNRSIRDHFATRTIAGIIGAMEYAIVAERLANARGLLQDIDPRVKVVGLLALISSAAFSRQLWVIAFIFIFALLLAMLSRVPLGVLAKRGWVASLLFTGMIALPAIFITPGPIEFRLPLLDWPVTRTGLRSASFLIARVVTGTTLSLLLVLTTPWAGVLKALRSLGLPVVMVVSLGMTYRYIFLFLQTAREMMESRESRTVGKLPGKERRRLAAAGVGVLLGKTMQLSGEVYLAMQSRGYQGESDTLDEFKLRLRDWMALAAMIVLAAMAFRFGR